MPTRKASSRPSTYHLGVEKSLAMLETISQSARPPMTSIHIHANTQSQRKMVLRDEGTVDNLSQIVHELEAQGVPHNATAGRHLLPEALNAMGNHALEEAAGQTIFCIGSLVKQLIILAFLVLLENGSLSPVTLQTPTRQAYNDVVDEANEPHIAQFSREPTIGQTAVHYDSYPPANRFLFSPNGQFLASDDDVVENLAEITENWMRMRQPGKKEDEGGTKVTYSNLNHAVLALILVKRCQKKNIAEVLQDTLFTPLGMTRSTLCRLRLEQLAAESPRNVAQGFRMSADLKNLFPIPNHDYMSSTVAQATVGAWSCTDDLAKLYSEVLKGYRDESKIFSRKTAEAFLAPRVEADKGEPSITFAGYMCDSRSPHLGCDSLNKELGMTGKRQGSSRERLLQRFSSSEYLHYKGGTADGFTSTVYLCVSEDVFAVALSNCTGPLDFSEPAARCMVQEVLLGAPPSHLATDVDGYLKSACLTWQQLEREDEQMADWVNDLSTFLGKYIDGATGRTMVVEDGEVVLRRNDRTLCRIPAAAHGNRIRLLPKSHGVFVDRVTVWRDLVFELRRDGAKSVLVGCNGTEQYVQQE